MDAPRSRANRQRQAPSACTWRFDDALSEEPTQRLHLLRRELYLPCRVPAWSVGNRDDQVLTGARPDGVEPVPLFVVELDDPTLFWHDDTVAAANYNGGA